MSPLRLISGLILFAFIAVAGNAALHLGLGICPLHWRHLNQDEDIPVIYGMPTDEAMEAARLGELVLGGCAVGPFKTVCPYCGWPTSLGRSDHFSLIDYQSLLTSASEPSRMPFMKPESSPDSSATAMPEIDTAPPLTAPAIIEDDDFGDEELGERQDEACSMDEGCTVCQ